MLQPPVTEVSCGLRCMRAARCVAASESKKNAACLHRCNLPRGRSTLQQQRPDVKAPLRSRIQWPLRLARPS